MDQVNLQIEGRQTLIILVSIFVSFILLAFIIFLYAFLYDYTSPQVEVVRNYNRCPGLFYGKRCQYFGPMKDWYHLYLNYNPSHYERVYAPTDSDKIDIINESTVNPTYKTFYLDKNSVYRSKDIFKIDSFSEVNGDPPVMIHKNTMPLFLDKVLISKTWTEVFNENNSKILDKGKLYKVNFYPRKLIMPLSQNFRPIYRVIISNVPFKEKDFDIIYNKGNNKNIRIFNSNNTDLKTIPYSWTQGDIFIMYK